MGSGLNYNYIATKDQASLFSMSFRMDVLDFENVKLSRIISLLSLRLAFNLVRPQSSTRRNWKGTGL